MTETATRRVRCGNHGRDFRVYHDTAADVRDCYAGRWSDDGAAAAEQAYERHLEDRGYDDARAQDDYEARNGVVSFSDAWDAACPRRVAERELEDEFARSDARAEMSADPGVPPVRRDSYERAAATGARRQDGPRRPSITKDGMYRNPGTGEIFKVQFNRAQGDGSRLYAKQLLLSVDGCQWSRIPLGEIMPKPTSVSVRFDYAPGAVGRLLPEWRMTMEEAKQFGALYGTCVRCGRTLTKEESIDRAMGPVCAKKENWG